MVVLRNALFPGCLRGCRRRQAAALLGVQFRRLGLMMNRKLTVTVSQIRVVRFLFVLLSLVVFRCLVVMVGRFLMITSGVMVMLPSFRYVVLLWWKATLARADAVARPTAIDQFCKSYF